MLGSIITLIKFYVFISLISSINLLTVFLYYGFKISDIGIKFSSGKVLAILRKRYPNF